MTFCIFCVHTTTYRLHGLSSQHTARTVTRDDFKKYEHIVCFDQKNIRELREVAPKDNKIVLLGSYDKELDEVEGIVEDPYYSSNVEAFEEVYQICVRACAAFLDSIEYDYV